MRQKRTGIPFANFSNFLKKLPINRSEMSNRSSRLTRKRSYKPLPIHSRAMGRPNRLARALVGVALATPFGLFGCSGARNNELHTLQSQPPSVYRESSRVLQTPDFLKLTALHFSFQTPQENGILDLKTIVNEVNNRRKWQLTLEFSQIQRPGQTLNNIQAIFTFDRKIGHGWVGLPDYQGATASETLTFIHQVLKRIAKSHPEVNPVGHAFENLRPRLAQGSPLPMDPSKHT